MLILPGRCVNTLLPGVFYDPESLSIILLTIESGCDPGVALLTDLPHKQTPQFINNG